MTQTVRRKQRDLFPVQETAFPHVAINRAVEFIDENHGRKLDLAQVAAHACLSKYHLSRLFHRMVGMSFQDYLIRVRVEQAKQLLTKTPYRSLTRIATQVGFGSLRNFEGQFKKVTRCCPSAYRARFEKQRARSFAKSARSYA